MKGKILFLFCLALSACCLSKKHRQAANSSDSAPPVEHILSQEETEALEQQRYERAYKEIHQLKPFAPRFVQATASPAAATLASKANDFGFRFYATLKNEQENAGKNLFFSPASLHTLLSMVRLGATDKGAQELEQALALQDIPNLPKEYYNLQGSILKGVEGKAELSLANAMFIKESAEISPAYRENVRKHFEAEIFQGSRIVGKINDWAKEQTRGVIPQIIDGLGENVEMVLLNALYFKAFWGTGYEFSDKTLEREFILADGKGVKAPFMTTQSNEQGYAYMENSQLAMLAIPYKDKAANLYIVLPAKGTSLENVEKQLSEPYLQDLIAQMRASISSNIIIPKIKMQANIQAEKFLKKMDIRRVFEGDLGGISRQMRLSQVIQKASINIEEWGTVAAAVSATSSEKTTAAKMGKTFDFIADRPFFFFIREEKMKSILFMGRVMNPTQE